MNSLICEYCNTEFISISSINNHRKNAKYCLIIQGKLEHKKDYSCNLCKKTLSSKRNLDNHMTKCKIIEEQINFNCKYCKKILSSKQNLINHLDICETKKEKELDEKNKKLEEKEKVIIEIMVENKNYKDQIEQQKEQIKELQKTIERMGLKAIERPTTTNNNNTLNITSFMDFDNIDKIKNAIEDKLDINYVVDGQKGLAHFVKDNLLTDDTGKLLYICTDPSRQIFKYKDSSGEVKKDVEAKKLTNYILEGGIRTKSAVLGNDWCKDDKGDINIGRFNVMIEQQQSIMKLSDDNNSFKKELVSLTS
jgi:predicted RNA-binding protein with EMAP domain